MTIKRLILAAVGVIAVTALAGCSGEKPQETTNDSQPQAPAPKPAPKPVVAPLAENASEPVALPPEKPMTADQQMMDDASTTGMTAHVSRDQEPANSEGD